MESVTVLVRKLFRRPRATRGFTLVEMLVVLVIIATITTIALLGQSTFNRSILLTDTAYTVALSLREMQSFGLSSRNFQTGSVSVQNAGYGARFDSTSPNSYRLYADTTGSSPIAACPVGTSGQPDQKPGNCRYDATDGTVQNYTFSGRFTIDRICGCQSNNLRCSTQGTPLTSLDVVFIRSNTTDAVITGRRNSSWIPLVNAEIYLESSDGGATRAICVSQIGQVSVVYGECPRPTSCT